MIEQVFADLIEGPLAHLPSGRFAAPGAWLLRASMAHNPLRAAGTRTSRTPGTARAATPRRQIITLPARLAHRPRDLHPPIPAPWPGTPRWQRLFHTTHRPLPTPT